MATKVHPPVKYKVTPMRIGRHPVEPFVIQLQEHRRSTALMLANRIHATAKTLLMSSEYEVTVDIVKGTFAIDRGRFGSGTIEKIEEGES